MSGYTLHPEAFQDIDQIRSYIAEDSPDAADRVVTALFDRIRDLVPSPRQGYPASVIDTGSPQGIAGHITSLGHEPEHYTIFYVEVEDVKASLEKATALGGKMVVPPVKIPTGTFAWFSDLDGNTIGLLQKG